MFLNIICIYYCIGLQLTYCTAVIAPFACSVPVCAEVELVDWIIALIVIGVIAYITGVCIAVILGTLLFLRAKKPDGM